MQSKFLGLLTIRLLSTNMIIIRVQDDNLEQLHNL